VTSVLPRPSAPAERTGGFHGRTISIISFSTDPDARGGFGPFTPGFDVVPYGDPGRRRRRGRLSAGRGARRGIVPLSAAVADADVLGVLQPGQHGSTFGGNPLACAVGRVVVELLADTGPDGMLARARRLGDVLHGRLAELVG
jgi:acetylornithine/succinyldiaminopimelate/putrescine aminotransferase